MYFTEVLASMIAWKKQKAVSEHLEWLNFKSRGGVGGVLQVTPRLLSCIAHK